MADDLLTISDLVADALDLADNEVSDLLNKAPFVARLPADESSNGTTHKYTKETGAPVVGFRTPNSGRDHDHSIDTEVSADLEILDYSWKVDKAVADAWRKGGPEAKIAREGRRHVRASLFAFEQQLINGTVGGASGGFVGMADVLDDKDDPMVVDATGAVAGTGSSVWAVVLGENDCMGVYKGDGPMMELGETIVQQALDGDGKSYPVYYTPGCTWLGMQVGSAFSFGRICNLTAENGKGLTDILLSQLLEQFPAGEGPDLLLMSRRSRGQLQRSRTTYSPTGQPAPLPQEYEGVPIVVTDAISNTETILTAA